MKQPAYDKTDVVGAMNRKELRDLARGMSFGQREMRMSGKTRDPSFVDAVCEMPAWASGIGTDPNELALYDEAKQSRLREINGDLFNALEARASIESEVMMIVNVVKMDLESDAAQLAATRAA